MPTKTDGFDQAITLLSNLQHRLTELEGNHNIQFSELFDSSFMVLHTTVSSFDDFLIKGGYGIDEDSFKAIPDNEFDEYVRNNSDFDSWTEMMEAATKIYVYARLGLK